MSQQLPVNNFGWMKDTSKFNGDFIQNCDEGSDEGYFLKVDVQYLEKLHEHHNDLLFWRERKVLKLVADLNNKTECVMHKRNLQ